MLAELTTLQSKSGTTKYFAVKYPNGVIVKAASKSSAIDTINLYNLKEDLNHVRQLTENQNGNENDSERDTVDAIVENLSVSRYRSTRSRSSQSELQTARFKYNGTEKCNKQTDSTIERMAKARDRLGKQSEQLGVEAEEHGKRAEEHGKRAEEHGKRAKEHGKRAKEHGKRAKEHQRRADQHARNVEMLSEICDEFAQITNLINQRFGEFEQDQIPQQFYLEDADRTDRTIDVESSPGDDD